MKTYMALPLVRLHISMMQLFSPLFSKIQKKQNDLQSKMEEEEQQDEKH